MKLLRVFILGLSILGLSACASSGNDDTAANAAGNGAPIVGAGGSGVQSQGLGNQSGFYGNSKKLTEQQLMDQNVIYFAFDSNAVSPQELPIVEAHAQYLAQNSNAKVLLEGNTDARGSREYNVALGYRRDQAVQQILEAAGVSPSQIAMVSYGSEKPAVLGQGEAAYSKNRRVVIVYENKA